MHSSSRDLLKRPLACLANHPIPSAHRFVSGRSLNRLPEQSLSLFLGLCTSAPAGPLTGYLSGLLASIPTGTIMSSLLSALNNFVMHKRWERRWGNPIRAADEPNFLYGHSTSELPAPSSDKGGTGSHSSADVDHGAVTHSSRWESAGRIKLMDSGMSNNLPNRKWSIAWCLRCMPDASSS